MFYIFYLSQHNNQHLSLLKRILFTNIGLEVLFTKLLDSFARFCNQILGNCQHDAEIRRIVETGIAGECLNTLLPRKSMCEIQTG